MFLACGTALGQGAVVPGGREAAAEEKHEPAKTVDELEARYFRMLGILKDPPATGVLVAELGPGSFGEKAGLRPGDILVEYLGVRLDARDEKNRAGKLRDAVTTAINDTTPGISPVVTMIVKRNKQDVVLTAERRGLGIRAIAVTAGIGAPQNPVPSEPGSFTLTWKEALEWYHVGDAAEPTAVERHSLALRDGGADLTVRTLVLESAEKPAARVQEAAIRMLVTDRSKTPAVALERLTYADEAVAVTAKVRRNRIEGEISRKITGLGAKVERPTVPEAVPSLAVTRLAAALPLKDGIVMPLAILSELDLQTRMGYALQTRGEATFKSGGVEKKGFAVRLWHFGQIEATYFFDENRALQYAEYEQGIGGATLRRAESEVDAMKALVIPKAGVVPGR